MRCEVVRSKLADYADDDVGPLDRIAIEVHTARCEACRGELNDLRTTLTMCRTTLCHPNPRDRFDELMRFIYTRERSRGIVRRVRIRRRRPVLPQMISAAAVIAILAVSAPFARGAKRLTDGIERSDTPVQTPAQAPLVSRAFVQRKDRIVTACRWSEDQNAADMPVESSDNTPLV